jgi:hypothetical protein
MGFPFEKDFSTVRQQGSGKNLHEGGLAGPVLADERMHGSGFALKGHVPECLNTTKRFGDVAHFKNEGVRRFTHQFIVQLRSSCSAATRFLSMFN